MDRRKTRRNFLRDTATTLFGGLAAGHLTAPRFVRAVEASASAAELVVGKDPRLIVHGVSPIELETPLDSLADSLLTPASLLFVRNNQFLTGTNALTAVALSDWTIAIEGLVDRAATVRLADLLALDQVEQEVVLQCSGNGRALFSELAPAKGAPWRCGAMGNVRFRGVPLAEVLRHASVTVAEGARFLTARGKDAPLKPGDADFEHSIPLDDALARSFLAFEMNGERLPAVHGGPVRLVTPGYYATMNVKWVDQLSFAAGETTNYHQVGRYRTPRDPIPPGSAFTSDLANSDANWRMRIKSVIFAPLANARVPAGSVELRGVAWNDGSTPLEAVLVSSAPERGWQPAQLAPSRGPYAWRPWSARLVLRPGDHHLVARAIDGRGRSQPLVATDHWNPAGYAYHAAHTIKVTATN